MRTAGSDRVTVVIATRDRGGELLHVLERLEELPDRPQVVVVDNASRDGTPKSVRRAFPEIYVVALERNLGAAARTVGAARARTPYIAFSDDDSWWAAGSLDRAADLLDDHPHVALLAARVIVGDDQRIDPVCLEMAASPLPPDGRLPGPPVLGFVACGSVVRRSAFLEAGGFHPRFGVGGEETLLALDLARRGWRLAYVDEIVAHHHPAGSRNPSRRRAVQVRNALWTIWLRTPLPTTIRSTTRAALRAARDRDARTGLVEAARGLPWVLRERDALPRALAEQFSLVRS